ncbi:MAG: exostosin family protein [Burkholderiales bacterium]|nr:exostosin family protein [Bacteroidia bacterium]
MAIKIKLYTEPQILLYPNTHTFLLFPLLGNYLKLEGDPDADRFDDFVNSYSDYIDFVKDPNECDFFLLPFGYSFETIYQIPIQSFLAKAENYHKKILLFFNSDDDTIIDIKNTIVFRTSFYESTRSKNVFALPGWSVDFAKYFPNQKVIYISKDVKPTISYCGYIDYLHRSFVQTIKAFLFNRKLDNDSNARLLRGLACRKLLKNKKIKVQFLFRDGFWASGIADKNKARLDYAQNMIDSMYAIVVRGAGNFSYRLYEVLSCGRIPIFINTDSVLPFDYLIDWKKHMVWIEEKDASKIDSIVLNFHKNKSDVQLKGIQESNRRLYVEYLSPNGFFKNFHLIL